MLQCICACTDRCWVFRVTVTRNPHSHQVDIVAHVDCCPLLQVLIVENQQQLPHALQQLQASMQDPYVAIDLEWRPEFGRRFTPVALMQLATSRTALLIRTCK